MAKPRKRKQLILSLIKDDLLNTKLVYGLNEMGLNADEYLLHLGDTIFKFMGIEDTLANEAIYEHYLYLKNKTKCISIKESHAALDDLALEIYNELLWRKKQ